MKCQHRDRQAIVTLTHGRAHHQRYKSSALTYWLYNPGQSWVFCGTSFLFSEKTGNNYACFIYTNRLKQCLA